MHRSQTTWSQDTEPVTDRASLSLMGQTELSEVPVVFKY